MKKLLIVFLLSGLSILHGAVPVRTAELKVDGKQLILENRLSGDWTKAPMSLSLFDGKANKFIQLPMPEIAEKRGKITLTYRLPELLWEITFSARNRVILGESTFVNRGKEEKFLEQFITLEPDFRTADLQLWDGFGKCRKADKPLSRKGIKGSVLSHIAACNTAFAASAVFSGKSAVSLGHVTFDPVSYTAVSYDPATMRYAYSQRFVLSPGEKLPLRHVIASCVGDYGGPEGVIQQHYDSFPEVWAVVGGQENPYAWGNCAHYRNWWRKPDPEESRRLRYTNEWGYVPYRRAGDMVMRKDLYDYKPDDPFRDKDLPKFGGVSVNYKRTSREDFLRIRRERYLKYGRRYGWMFYNSCSGTWCEKQLAEKFYPDSLTEDSSVPRLLKGWSTVHDWEVRVFPMGTSWAAAFEQDMKTVAEELDLPGFALDCGDGGAYYRGPAVRKMLPGRAWDEKGAFIDQGVAVNHVTDFIHSLRSAPDQLTVHINGEQKGDFCMLERPFLNLGAMRQMLPLYRWFIGPRPGNVHGHGFLLKEMMPDWRDRNQAEFIDLIGRLSDYQIMNQFRWGLSQTYVTFYGNPQQVYILPESLELIRAGWQASTPVKLPKDLRLSYLSRYGRGENTFFFFGNTGRGESRGTLAIDNSELTDGGVTRFVFVQKLRNKAESVNRIERKFSKIDAVFPSRTPVLFETVCGFASAPETFTATAGSEKTLEKQLFTVKLAGEKFVGDLSFRKIRFFRPASLTVSGKPVTFSEGKDCYFAEHITFDRGSEVKILYVSDFFRLPREKIINFPYVDQNNRVTFLLHVSGGDEAAMKLTERFREYFDFCGRKKILPSSAGPQVSRNDAVLNRRDVISLQIVPGKPDTVESLPGGGILIRAKDVGTLEKMIRQFAGVMDLRFPYIFRFSGVMGLELDQLVHFRMIGKFIPERRYFE